MHRRSFVTQKLVLSVAFTPLANTRHRTLSSAASSPTCSDAPGAAHRHRARVPNALAYLGFPGFMERHAARAIPTWKRSPWRRSGSGGPRGAPGRTSSALPTRAPRTRACAWTWTLTGHGGGRPGNGPWRRRRRRHTRPPARAPDAAPPPSAPPRCRRRPFAPRPAAAPARPPLAVGADTYTFHQGIAQHALLQGGGNPTTPATRLRLTAVPRGR